MSERDYSDKSRLTYGHLPDAEIAGKVRMLMRTDLCFEPVLTGARDRIMHLSQRVADLEKRLAVATGNVCSDPINAIREALAYGYLDTNPPPARHWLAEFWQRGRTQAKAESIADQAMRELLEAEGMPDKSHTNRYSPVDCMSIEVRTLAQAAEPIREAYEWLAGRGLAELVTDEFGEQIQLKERV